MLELGNLAQIGSAVVALTALAISLISARDKKVSGKADKSETIELFDRMRTVEKSLAETMADLEHMPSKDTAHRMEMAIARLEGRLETMDERLKPVAAMAGRMQELMLERATSK